MLKTDFYPTDAAAITPSDSADNTFCGFYVGGTGDVTVVTQKGATVTFKACPVGFKIYLAIAKVKSTGTTATLLIGLVP